MSKILIMLTANFVKLPLLTAAFLPAKYLMHPYLICKVLDANSYYIPCGYLFNAIVTRFKYFSAYILSCVLNTFYFKSN